MGLIIYKILVVLVAFKCIQCKTIPSDYVSTNPEEGDLFEGDIIGVETKGANQIPTQSRLRWDPIINGKGAIIPYEISTYYTQSDKDVILSAFKMVEELTRTVSGHCIKFVPYSLEETFIRIINDTGCYSYVGKQSQAGVQKLSLQSPGCIVKGIIAHEFIHALGFWHEQSRPDRDDYITVNYNNMQTGKEHNFNKYNTSQVDYLNQEYDYDSIMHYGSNSFSKNGDPTILPKDETKYIGQRKTLSPVDIEELRSFYNC